MVFVSTSRYFYCFYWLCLALLAFCVVETLAAKPMSSFSFKRFDANPSFNHLISLYGDAEIVNGGSSVEINRPTVLSSGRLVYRNPIRFPKGNPRKPMSFSSYFSFSISPGDGDGLAFMLIPGGFDMKVVDGGSFGVNGSGNGVLMVEFDTFMNVENGDPNANHVGIDMGSLVSARVGNVSSLNLVLNSGERLHTWIDFEASSKRLEVRLSKRSETRPNDPLVSYQVDLAEVWKDEEEVFVGIGSSSGNSTQTSNVYAWSFRLREVPTWMHSEPFRGVGTEFNLVDVKPTKTTAESRSVCAIRTITAVVFGIGCGALVASIVLFMWAVFGDKRSTAVVPAEYPVHSVEFGYEKIKIVAEKAKQDGKKEGL